MCWCDIESNALKKSVDMRSRGRLWFLLASRVPLFMVNPNWWGLWMCVMGDCILLARIFEKILKKPSSIDRPL